MKKVVKIRRNKAIELLNEIKKQGHSFGVHFIKKNGEYRKMLARMGAIPKYTKKTDKNKPYNGIDYGLITVLDVNKTKAARVTKESAQVYRQINVNTLCCINYGGLSYQLIGNELDVKAYKSNAL